MSGLPRRPGIVRHTRHHARLLGLAGACILLISPALVGCASATSPKSVAPGFTGYVWRVVAISHDGQVTSIPSRLQVSLRFSPGGQFGANDSINFHSGTYRRAGDGFTTGALSTTSVGYAGEDPAVLLAISAIDSFDNSVRATAALTADRLVVAVGTYTLTCKRTSRQADIPAPAGTGR
jgi:hypothetical protein